MKSTRASAACWWSFRTPPAARRSAFRRSHAWLSWITSPTIPTLLDDFETYPYLWTVDRKATLTNPEIAAGDPLALPGQGAYEHVLQAGQKNGTGAYDVRPHLPHWPGLERRPAG